jgi:hypothetical protein
MPQDKHLHRVSTLPTRYEHNELQHLAQGHVPERQDHHLKHAGSRPSHSAQKRTSDPRPGFRAAAFRFPPEVIVVAVRWYLRYCLSYRDVEELLVERGVEVDHVTLFR